MAGATAEFDSFAHDYDAALNRGLAASGEDKSYFAKGRIRWLARCLKRLAMAPATILDYGCGTGGATPHFLEHLGAQRVVGVDVSAKSIDVARRNSLDLPAEYALVDQYRPRGAIDLAFCNGVFHHIPPGDRGHAVRYIADCLRPGGLFALWENNPWNPGTRYIMSRIPFDRDAVTMTGRESGP